MTRRANYPDGNTLIRFNPEYEGTGNNRQINLALAILGREGSMRVIDFCDKAKLKEGKAKTCIRNAWRDGAIIIVEAEVKADAV